MPAVPCIIKIANSWLSSTRVYFHHIRKNNHAFVNHEVEIMTNLSYIYEIKKQNYDSHR